LLKALLERDTEPFLQVQDPDCVGLGGFRYSGFALWNAVYVFCACGAEELVGPVR
jgi:hypothetical protein